MSASFYCTLATPAVLNPFSYPYPGCGDPPDIENGDVTFTETTPGSTANYTCNSPFVLPDGDNGIRTCQATGLWEDAPICGELYILVTYMSLIVFHCLLV